MRKNPVSTAVWNAGHRRSSQGFTLIELMIAVAVIAILASIAIPSYQQHVIKTRRATAAACMMEAAHFMERYHTTNLRYSTAAGGNPTLPACSQDVSAFYTVGFNGTATATTYRLQAVPQGAQATKDTTCGTLGINQTGAKSISTGGTSVTDAATVRKCF